MKIFKHNSYDEYVEAQTKKNMQKLDWVFVREEEINAVVDHIRSNISNPTFGICHGSRNGFEVKKFREKLGIEVIGTEISPTAQQFPNTIQWDFHDIKDEWIDNVDFIYSNSIDHSYDPIKCIDSWMKCLKKTGVCYIHYTNENQTRADSADCFAANLDELKSLIRKKYKIIQDIDVTDRTIVPIIHQR